MAEQPNGKFKLNAGTISIIVLLIIQLVAFSFGYGMLTQQVSSNREIIKTYQAYQISLANEMSDMKARLVRIETILKATP